MKKGKNELKAVAQTGMYSMECIACGKPMVGGERCFVCEFNDVPPLPYTNFDVGEAILPVSLEKRLRVDEILKDIALTREAIDRIEAELDRTIVEGD